MAILCLEDSFVVAHFRLTFQNLSEHFDRHGGIKRHERGKGGRGTQVSFLFFLNFFFSPFSFIFGFADLFVGYWIFSLNCAKVTWFGFR